MCSCTTTGTNPITHQTGVTWQASDDGSCEPKCVYCWQDATTGNCDVDTCPQEDGPCQFHGSRCNVPRCYSGGGWNGTHCEGCVPNWLFSAHTNPTCNPTGPTVCTVRAGLTGPPPPNETTFASSCVCAAPYRVDNDPYSDTFRLCIEGCPHNQRPHSDGSAVCECIPGLGPPLICNTSICGANIAADLTDGTCHCEDYPQWGGVLCDQSMCVGGTPRDAPDIGCDCYPRAIGTLCEHDACGVHGEITDITNPLASCHCEPGWEGPSCHVNRCDVPTDPVPDPGEPLGYRCQCEPAGVYHAITGRCIVSCGGRGEVIERPAGSLTCVCQHGFNSTTCDNEICQNPLQHYSGDLDRCICNSTDGECHHFTTCAESLADAETVRLTADNVHLFSGYPYSQIARYPEGSDVVRLVEDNATLPDGTSISPSVDARTRDTNTCCCC